MCGHRLHAALWNSRDALCEATGSLSREPLSIASLQCAVSQTRKLTAELAGFADALANHAVSDLSIDHLSDTRAYSGPVDRTMQDILDDLHTMVGQLTGGDLLLEPAEDDLAHLRAGYPAERDNRSEQDLHG
jgi:hypothetical protein